MIRTTRNYLAKRLRNLDDCGCESCEASFVYGTSIATYVTGMTEPRYPVPATIENAATSMSWCCLHHYEMERLVTQIECAINS